MDSGRFARLSLPLLLVGGVSCLSACGGAADTLRSADDQIALVGRSPVTIAAVNHWMGALAGNAFYSVSKGRSLPGGLLSDPPRYSRCVERLHAVSTEIVPDEEGGRSKVPRLNALRLMQKCRLYNEALRTEALELLLNARQEIEGAKELGIVVRPDEIDAVFQSERASAYRTDQELHKYLASHGLTLPDLLLETHLNMIGQKISERSGGSSKRALEQLAAISRRWTERTTCSAGYVVEHCKEFKRGAPTFPYSPPASIETEQLVALITGVCFDQALCNDQ
jgi:hypothetical protein